VNITVSNNAIPAHDRHQDDEDIIPANGDCPGGTARTHGKSHSNESKSKSKSHSNENKSNSAAEHGKTTICHSTASVTNPFVRITISNNALAAHRRHHNGDDIIPASGDCPAGSQPATQEQGGNNGNPGTPGTEGAPISTVTPVTPGTENTAASNTPANGSSPAAGTEGANTQGAENNNGSANGGGVLGANAQGGTQGASSTGTSGPSGSLAGESASGNGSGNSGLPFTGWDVGIVAAIGAALLLAGTALRRARRTSRARP
jgi:hypothetical protein